MIPVGFDETDKTPRIALAIELGAGPRNTSPGRKRVLLLGNATGAIVPETAMQIVSLDEGRIMLGAKSELFQGVLAAFAQHRGVDLWVCAVPENISASAATTTLSWTGTATESGVVRVWIRDQLAREVVVAARDPAAIVAWYVAEALKEPPDWPFVVTHTPSTVTLTCANKGPRGNTIPVRVEVAAPGITVALNGGQAATSVDGRFTGGAGIDDISNALAAVAMEKFDLIALAHNDAQNLERLKQHLARTSSIDERRRQQGIAATFDVLTTAKTLALGVNSPLMQLVWHYAAENTLLEVAAQVAVARLHGDSSVAAGLGASRGEMANPAANLNGTMLATVRRQHIPADRPLAIEVRDALDHGLTPLVPTSANAGYCYIARSITSFHRDAAGNATTRVLDTSKVTVTYFVADEVEAGVAIEFRHKNIAPDPPDNRGPSDPDIVFPSMIRGYIASRLLEFERRGYLVNVDSSLKDLVVRQSPTNRSVVLALIPIEVIDSFAVFAGTVQQLG